MDLIPLGCVSGMSHEGVELLQRYVDRTGDVQTASIVAVHCIPEPEFTRDSHVNNWIIAYQDLLDTWRLWNQRYLITKTPDIYIYIYI